MSATIEPTRSATYRSRTDAPAEALWSVYADPDGLAKVTDPRDGEVVARSDGALRVGFEVSVRVRVAGLPILWTSVITEFAPPHHFVDEARRGPFAAWRHRHGVEAASEGAWLVDRVDYTVTPPRTAS